MTRTALLLVGAVAGTLALAGCAAEAPSATIHQVATSAAADAGTLDAAAFAAVVDEPGTVVLDVRTPGEFTSGHIAGARNLDGGISTWEAWGGEVVTD